MFTAHTAPKDPLQSSEESTTLSLVRLELQIPWFIATLLDDQEKRERAFLLARCDEVLSFAEHAAFGILTALTLVQPPDCSPNKDWACIQMRRIERTARPPEDVTRTAVVTGVDGVRYGGLPVRPLTETGLLWPVVDLHVEGGEGPRESA
jgi:hypothetical protein